MTTNDSRISTERKTVRLLAVMALVLGAVAVFGDPYGGDIVTLNTKELANLVEREVDHVTAEELADWIIQGRSDYRLIDVRYGEESDAYRIPTAESVPIAQLPDYPLDRNEKIVLYSNGGIHSAQAWFLLRAKGYRGVYMLLGGLEAWKEDILFPTAPSSADPEEAARFAKAIEVSRYFGGSPREAGAAQTAAAEALAMPKVELPTNAPVARKKKKHKEGC